MDSRLQLEYIVENVEYVGKLGAALDTTNCTVKKQVFELLSALCAYNSEGYARATEILEHYKVQRHDYMTIITAILIGFSIYYNIGFERWTLQI